MDTSTLDVQRRGGVLYVTLDQPATRNALSARMVDDLRGVARRCRYEDGLRAVVLRGAGGNFCAGGDLADFRTLRQTRPATGEADPIALANRAFGRLLQEWQGLPQTVLAVVEGAAMGGGVGLAAVCDLVLAEAGARFAMPETSLGLPPAQILPFVALRIGATQA
ncbi:MAG: enoyl-CoA hydratase/isomerase family protein, partial [Burkholderiaceae bacterium]